MHLLSSPPLALPPWKKTGKRLESLMRKALYQFCMLDLTQKKQKIAVALSGGKDSLSLLFLLNAISGRGFPELEIHALHIDGVFSCGASIGRRYLQSICAALHIPLHIKTAEGGAPKECYSCSRKRRSLLFSMMKELDIQTIAFGHHRDDSIETLLMNLLHKAEFAANLPKLFLQKYHVTLIRPLIYISEKEIHSFATSYGFARIMCQCPVGQSSYRKKVKDLLNHIEELYPHTRDNLSQASHIYGSTKAANP